MKIKEKVLKVQPMTSYQTAKGDTGYSRDLILITDEKYPKEVALTFSGANCKLLDVIHPNDIVEVTFDISSFKSKTSERYFTSLNAWKLDIIQSADMNAAPEQNNAATATAANAAESIDPNPLII